MDMDMQPLPVCCGVPAVPKLEHAHRQSSVECEENSFLKPDPFLLPDVTVKGDPDVSVGGRSPDATIPQFGRLKMLASEACLKNFAIFDCCEDKGTVIVHPSWLKSPQFNSLPDHCFARETKYTGGGVQPDNLKSLEAKVDIHSSAVLSTVGLKVPVHTCAIAMEWQQKVASFNLNLKEDIIKEGTFLSDGEEVSFHENTEDIDALMSSDEELISTGHSPSDASSNPFSEASNIHEKKTARKKRKVGNSAIDEADDADSGPSKLLSADQTLLNSSKRSGSSVLLHWLGGSDRKHALSSIEASKVSNRRAKGSTVNDVCAEGWDCESLRSYGTYGGGLIDGWKRIKIKSSIRQLRNVVPGGDGLDTAGVLGQTIQYVKCLQSRLRDLGTAREFRALTSGQAGPR